jgi:hypothetical protein
VLIGVLNLRDNDVDELDNVGMLALFEEDDLSKDTTGLGRRLE